MDRAKALEIMERLSGKMFAGWQIDSFIDNGKSAAVFRGSKDGRSAAIKIFDTDLITRFGGDAILTRTEREKQLLNHGHPNLVKMLDAGVDEETGQHFLAMEFLEGRSLADCLDDVPPENIPLLIEQLASAAQFLEGMQLAHRDIKPANIMISNDFATLTLLDLGVLKPIGEVGLTDHGDALLFVGTNQYASPEFAMRREKDDLDGWRALTFYQMGAVLHDLIMKQPIFAGHVGVPARLADAVQNEVVQIRSAATPPWLVSLAQNCLVKSPETRLRLVRWESFKPKSPKADQALELRDRILQRAAAAITIEEERKLYQSGADRPDEQTARMASALILETLRTVGRSDAPTLGRRIVFEVGSEPIVRCEFEPSERIGIPGGLTVCIRHEVTDRISRVIGLSGCHTASASGDWEPGEWDHIFEGPWDETEIEAAIGLFVLTCVDHAQASALGGES
jgi:serine/threonine protein kinase